MFIIEDSMHSEIIGDYENIDEALVKLKELSTLSWSEEPNKPPCVGWEHCHRSYDIIEYDNSTIPWRQIRIIPGLEISSRSIYWHEGIKNKICSKYLK